MNNNYIMLKSHQKISGFNSLINLPEKEKISYLINNKIVISINKPTTFVNGLIISITDRLEEDILLLILNENYFESLNKGFKDSSFEWFKVV